jgi:hypothetical protein
MGAQRLGDPRHPPGSGLQPGACSIAPAAILGESAAVEARPRSSVLSLSVHVR